MRKLAAIMFTDIKGFTSIMQKDEANALELLARHKELFLKYTRQFKGKVIKYMGDGTLTIFDSAIQAVRCAIALQQAFTKEPVIPVRIGVHIGEVIVENQDVIGDAVNLSSRIQAAGIAGSVFISEKVRDEIYNHVDIVTVSLGAYSLKNVLNPIKLYAIAADGLKVPDINKSSTPNENDHPGKSFIPPNLKILLTVSISILLLVFGIFTINNYYNKRNNESLKSIAVLPFQNVGQGEQDNYLAAGLTEDLISLLNVIPHLTVKKIPEKAIVGYKESLIESLLKEIKVGSVLSGTVKHPGDSLVISAQLKDARSGKIMWEKVYQDKYIELNHVQQKVVEEIAGVLHSALDKDELKKFASKRSTNPEAQDLYKKGRFAQVKRSKPDMDEALYYFRKSLSLDPSFALAYSGISDNYVIQIDNGILPYDSGIENAGESIKKAFELDSTLAEVRASKALFLITLEGKRDVGIRELQDALNKMPNYGAAHQWYAVELAAESKLNLALNEIDKAMELEPFSERVWVIKGMILLFARRFKDVIELMSSLKARFPNSKQSDKKKAECYYWLGQADSVLKYARNTNDVFDYTFWEPVVHHNKLRLESDFMQKVTLSAKQNTPLTNEQMATYYVFLGNADKALTCMENAFNKKEFSWLKFLNVSPTWDPLRKEPRFNNLLLKIGF